MKLSTAVTVYSFVREGWAASRRPFMQCLCLCQDEIVAGIYAV